MDTSNMIEVTHCKLTDIAKAAYDLSEPVGLGFLHYKEGSLTDEEAEALVAANEYTPLSLDYVKGRCCKLTVWANGGRLYISDSWYDHTPEQLQTLLERIKF